MKTEYAGLVGLDCADQKHVLCYRETATGQKGSQTLEQCPERINEWIAALRAKLPGGRIAVCLEQSRGPVVYALMGYAEVDIYPVNPVTLADYRNAFRPSGAKDDPTDAALLLDLLEPRAGSVRFSWLNSANPCPSTWPSRSSSREWTRGGSSRDSTQNGKPWR